jgi:hypothetical protein
LTILDLIFFLHGLLFVVRPGVELHEQPEEHDHVCGADGRLDDRVAALVAKDQEKAVSEDGGKLDQLELGEVALPPEILLKARAEGGEEVVGVHDDVHNGVEEGAKGLVTAGDKSERGDKR